MYQLKSNQKNLLLKILSLNFSKATALHIQLSTLVIQAKLNKHICLIVCLYKVMNDPLSLF